MPRAAVLLRLCLWFPWLAVTPGCFYDWDEYVSSSVCAGSWSAPELVLYAPFNMSTIAVSLDGRELFVLRSDGADPPEFWQLRRGSLDEPFLEGVAATGLTNVCVDTPGPLGIDIAASGLVAFVTCQGPNELEPGPVRMLSRPSGEASFGDADSEVGDAWSGGRVSADELTLYSSGHPAGSAPLQASRGSTDDDFGAPSVIGGLDLVPLEAPAPSSDTLTLFGTLTDATTQLGFVTRSDAGAPFGDFSAIYTGLDAAGAPVVQPDCRALYFLAGGTNNGTAVHSREVHALRR